MIVPWMFSTIYDCTIDSREIEPVIHLKYIIMRIFNDIICITALPWQHEFKILLYCTEQAPKQLAIYDCTQLTKTFGSKRSAVDLSFSCVLLKNLLSVESCAQL